LLPMCFFYQWTTAHFFLHSFPTHALPISRVHWLIPITDNISRPRSSASAKSCATNRSSDPRFRSPPAARHRPRSSARTAQNFERSEEHTSELQSRSDLVCRLLLGKKKNIS